MIEYLTNSDNGDALKFYIKGRMEPEEFVQAVARDYSDEVEPSDVSYEWWRWVPCGYIAAKNPSHYDGCECGMLHQMVAQPHKRGAFQVTTAPCPDPEILIKR